MSIVAAAQGALPLPVLTQDCLVRSEAIDQAIKKGDEGLFLRSMSLPGEAPSPDFWDTQFDMVLLKRKDPSKYPDLLPLFISQCSLNSHERILRAAVKACKEDLVFLLQDARKHEPLLGHTLTTAIGCINKYRKGCDDALKQELILSIADYAIATRTDIPLVSVETRKIPQVIHSLDDKIIRWIAGYAQISHTPIPISEYPSYFKTVIETQCPKLSLLYRLLSVNALQVLAACQSQTMEP